MDAARHLGRLHRPVKGGGVEGEHIAEFVRQGKLPASALDGPDIPEALAYLWTLFERLLPMREYGEYGPQRFTPPFLDAACRLFDWRLAPHEVEALVQLDAAYLHPDAA